MGPGVENWEKHPSFPNNPIFHPQLTLQSSGMLVPWTAQFHKVLAFISDHK